MMQSPSLDVVNRAIGVELGRLRYSYTERDVALYALGIGAPADPLDQDELRFVYELSGVGFEAFPTFAAVFAYEFNRCVPAGEIAGIQFNPMMAVHGEQFLRVLQPLPTAANVASTIRIADIFDKGSGMLLVVEIESFLDDGPMLAQARQSLFLRGLGGYGGPRGPATKVHRLERPPDTVHEERTSPAQALLYRLAGDNNPLHADPQMAAIGHFEKPILHGLCTMGFAARAVLKRCAGNEPKRFDSISVRFSSHVYPGETLVTEIWRDKSDTILFQTKVKERDIVVLSQGEMRLPD
ncbi:MAG: MaoC/PaaZ C-terminal domain-containing protein [Chloroflexota bacterium]|nr:MaoC/PaaZ C-terminal domain-containing protein [Chloroflexota bacterium]